MKNWIQESPQYRDFFPAEFWRLVEKDLNGCFGCRYYEDAKQDLVGRYFPNLPNLKMTLSHDSVHLLSSFIC